MGELLFMAHSGLRYLVLVFGAAVFLLALAGLAAGAASGAARVAARVFRVFVVLLDVQVLLGIGAVLSRPFQPIYIGHIVMMAGAVIIAHAFAIAQKKRAPERRSPVLILLAVVLSMALVIGGIMALQRAII